MEQRLSLITLGVTDLDRARRFYEDGLGWTRGNVEDEVAFYQLPGMVFALWSRTALADDANVIDTGAAFSGITLAFNARTSDEVDELLGQVVDAGGSLLKPAVEALWGGYSGYCADPDGHPWEIAYNPFWTVDPEGQTMLASP